MTPEFAYQILGLPVSAAPGQIKKRYHQLLHQIHPDTDISGSADYPYTIQELNEAYTLLYKEGKLLSHRSTTDTVYKTSDAASARTFRSATGHNRKSTKGSRASHTSWHAPVNPYAYTDREIYHYAEDSDGNPIGVFPLAYGKYLWTPEEDFSLFLKSMYTCSDRLLSEVDQKLQHATSPARRLVIQAELSYLLSQQFIDLPASMDRLLSSKETKNSSPDQPQNDTAPKNGTVYTIPSMLESSGSAVSLRAGMILYPSGIKKHRLFLQTADGRAAGYVSFKDDRLYYVLIPLLEQKRAQVKISVAPLTGNCTRHNHTGQGKYRDLLFQLRLSETTAGNFPESIQLQIETLLRSYEQM